MLDEQGEGRVTVPILPRSAARGWRLQRHSPIPEGAYGVPLAGAAAKTVDDYQCLPGVRLYGKGTGARLPWYAVTGLK